MRNEVDDKYAALPERLYVLDKDGRVYYNVDTTAVNYWITSDRHGQ